MPAIHRQRMFRRSTMTRSLSRVRASTYTNYLFLKYSANTTETNMLQDAIDELPATENVAGVAVPLDTVQIKRLSAKKGVAIAQYANRSSSGAATSDNLRFEFETGVIQVEWLRLAYNNQIALVSEVDGTPVQVDPGPLEPEDAFANLKFDANGLPSGISTIIADDADVTDGGSTEPNINRTFHSDKLYSPRVYARSVPVIHLRWSTTLSEHPGSIIDDYLQARVNEQDVTFIAHGDSFVIRQYCGWFNGAKVTESGDDWLVTYHFIVRPDPWVQQRVGGDGKTPVYEAMSATSDWTSPGFPVAEAEA